MLLFFKCLILVSLLPGVSQKPARETRQSRDIKELTRLESVWNQAHLRGDAAALDKLWSEDLFVTVPDMPVMNKEESLAIWKSGKLKFDIYRTSDIRIRVYGDSAVVTGQLVRIRDTNSTEFEDDWRFTKVYVRRQGKWLVVTWHGSHVGSS
jgi:ketosteroid isomerase-like protein